MKRILALMMCVVLAACALPAFAQDSYYTASTPIYIASDAQLINILKAADALNGWYVPSGGYFSFNDAVGPRTYEDGYVDAVNGRGSDVIGGGVSQVATTLYLALLQMQGIHYSQITTYDDRFTAGYVSDGSMAVVTDYAAAVDFCFINDSGYDLALRLWNDGVFLYCEVGTGEETGMPSWDGSGFAQEDTAGALISGMSFPIGASSGLVTNITRAAENIGGVVLEPGMEFSFNDMVGPRTEEYGFVSAINGRGVTVIGGGVAQVASVVWLAVKNIDTLTITEKSTYGSRYNQDYVASAEDAIVTDYNAGTDFAFRNDGAEAVTVDVYVENGVLYCNIYAGSVDPDAEPAPAPNFFDGLNW